MAISDTGNQSFMMSEVARERGEEEKWKCQPLEVVPSWKW